MGGNEFSLKRSPSDWELHDNVIRRLKTWLESKHPNCYVIINPGQERNQGVTRDSETVYPDVVFRPSRGENITRLYEVETVDSVDEEEVIQWKTYDAGPSSFYFVVPENTVDVAKELIRRAEFSIDGFYYYDRNLDIHIDHT